MLSWIARLACLAFALTAGTVAARAADLADFNAAVEQAQSHNRAAIGYLRTGNIDLAAFQLDRLRESWGLLQQRFAGARPDVFNGVALYGSLWTVVNARLVAADLMLKTGRPDAARQSLEAIRGDLYDLRKVAGIAVLADCVRDANTAMDALMAYDDGALDWSQADARADLANKASAYGALLARCDGIAGETVRGNPEFRRLVDGAQASLKLISQAIADRDGGLLHRVLIELRSFDNILAFRFG